MKDYVLFVQLTGSLTAPEQPTFFETIANLSLQSPGSVHLIVDMRQQTERLSIREATQNALKHPMPRNLGWVIQVGNMSKPQIFLSSLIAQFFSVSLYAVSEVDEAVSYLKFHDDTIDWLLADYDVLVSPNNRLDVPGEIT